MILPPLLWGLFPAFPGLLVMKTSRAGPSRAEPTPRSARSPQAEVCRREEAAAVEGRGAAPSFSGVLSPAVRKNPENPCCPGPPPPASPRQGSGFRCFSKCKDIQQNEIQSREVVLPRCEK